MTSSVLFTSARALLAALVCVVAVAGVVVAPGRAGAAPADDTITWQIQPSSKDGPTTRPYFTYQLKPGATVTDYVGVTNLGESPLTVTVYASDAFNSADGAFDVRAGADEPVDVGMWVSLAKNSVTLAPRTRADIPFTVVVPENATPGDHVGGVVASVTSTTSNAAGNTVKVDRRVGSRMYVRVDGPITAGLAVEDLQTSFKASANPLDGGVMMARYTVRNTGNVRLGAHQKLTVDGPIGLFAATDALADLPELLPGNAITQTVQVDHAALARLRSAVTVSPFAGTDAGFPMPAVTSADAPDVTVTASNWAFAWWHVPVLLIVLAALWILTRRIVRVAARRRRTGVGPVAAMVGSADSA